MNRAFTNLLVENVAASARFYEALLGMTRHGDFGWFVILTHPDMPGFELGLLDRTHGTVPAEIAAAPRGVVLTFVVDDVAAVHARAAEIGAEILQPPTDLPYGQRRLLLSDPDGTPVDVSSPTPR